MTAKSSFLGFRKSVSQAVKDIRHGERAILVCNDPSLNKKDFKAMKNEHIIDLNKIHLRLNRFGLNPDCIIAINNLIIE